MSTEDQRAAMLETLSQASEWMFGEGDGAKTKVGEGMGCHDNIVLTAIMFGASRLAGIAPDLHVALFMLLAAECAGDSPNGVMSHVLVLAWVPLTGSVLHL